MQDAIGLVFDKFEELHTARQVLIWMKQQQVLLPFAVYKSGKRSVEWRTPKYRSIYHILTNPIYGGAYVFGRRRSVVKIENGRKRIIHRMRRNWTEWDVLIKEHHEGYISWESLKGISD